MKNIHKSAEDYLETILLLSKKGQLRSIDIVNETGYSKPSISEAMKNLREKDLIKIDSNGYITLTCEGQGLAEKVYARHIALYDWLISIGVSEKNAEMDACKIEHDICDETYLAIKKSCQNCVHCEVNK